MKKQVLISAFALCAITFARAQTPIIITVAGNHSVGGYSGDGGQAVLAQLYDPVGVCIDASGNLYIADYANSVIRKVNPAGIITTFAGNHTPGYNGDGGQATAAQLFYPKGVCIDAFGNLYIADLNNNVIRKVNTAGIITTVAGNGTAGYNGDGGQATAAELFNPSGVAVDASGNLYIADYANSVIRKVNTAGIITTFAGNHIVGYNGDGGQATAAELKYPTGVCIATSGNLNIADEGSNVIRQVNTAGVITTIAGNGTYGYSGDGGQATAAKLYGPVSVCIDAFGNMYIADKNNNVIRKVNTAGIITTVAGNYTQGYSGDGGQATAAALWTPSGVCIDASSNLYIADYDNNVIREVGSCIPLIPSICMIEVDSTSTNNIIYWNKTQYPSADTFYIYRDTSNNNYAPIGKVAASALSMFADTVRSLYSANGDPNVTSWRYKIAYTDTCGGNRTMSAKSPWHQTIYQYNIGGLFIWNHYQIEGQPTPVPGLSNYILKRDNVGGTYAWVTAATASASSTNINDPQYSTYQTTGDWKVETLWTTSCTPTLRYGNNGAQTAVVKSRSNVRNNRVTGIKQLNNNGINIYPNPNNGILNIQADKQIENASIEIYNVLGEKVFTELISASLNKNTQVDVSNLANGIYQVRLLNSNAVIYQSKIVKQ